MDYLNQIFYEGLGKSIYVPIENRIKKINNNKLSNILIGLYKTIYMLLAIMIAIILFIIRL